MVGSKIKHDQKGDHGELPRRRKISIFGKYLLAPVVAVSVFLGGNNINYLGVNSVMAQPATRRRGATHAEQEEVAGLQQRARDAATAYQSYILTGNEADYTRYRALITSQFQEQPVTENREFMDELHSRMTTMRSDAQVRPILEAYEADLDHVIGIRMEPSIMEDFITKVREIRTRLAANATTWALIDAVVQRVERAGETEAPAESEIGRFRAYRRAHTDATAEDAARHVLEGTGLAEIRERHGENLTNLLSGELPNQQATRCVDSLRNFMLTGDTAQRDEFRRIFGAHSTSGEFWTGFQRLFLERITRDQVGEEGHRQPSPISLVYRSYYTHHNNQVDPEAFATAVSQMYEAASTGNVSRLQELRQAHGNETVDRFVDIISLGLARRCATLMEQVLATGSTTARDEFIRIYSGNFVAGAGEIGSRTYTRVPLERNDTFFNEFVRLYRAQIQGNSTVSSIEMNFRRNVRSIAIRDIYIELLRSPPNMDRLRGAYSPELIALVSARRPTWMIRTATDLNRVLTDRAREEDIHARRISSMTIRVQAGERPDRGAALADVYGQLATERLAIGAVPAGSIITEHYAELSWLAGTPEQVQAELDRRSAPGRGAESDEVAVQLKALFPQDGGTTLSEAYAQITLFRQTRELLATRYGSEFVNYVSQNLDTLHWAVRPVGQIEHEMTTRTSDVFVRDADTLATQGGAPAIGYSIGGLARALHAIYAAHGQASPTTAELVTQYGQAAVDFVTQNRAQLGWLGGNVTSIEQRLLRGQDDITRSAKELLFPFTPVQFILSYASGREALTRGGLARMDGIDSLGRFFLTPVASREAARTRGISGEALEGSRGEITANSSTIERDLESMRRQLEDPMLAPARPMLEERINRWEEESRRIRLAAGGADQAEIQTLLQEQRALQESMISGTELRRSVELAFSMIHLAETGGDLSRTAGSIDGFSETIASSSDVGSLRSGMTWYSGVTNPDKQAVIGDIIFAVLGRADPELRAFISSMGDRGFSRDLGTAYNAISRGSGNVADVQRRHGTEFVRLINDHRPVLGFLENLTGISEQNLRMGQNVLFANITIRVYRAIARPDGTETRERMVELYGDRFVSAVERQREHLAPLAEARAGLEEVTALPESVRQSLYRAYPQAYTRVVTALHRAYRHQDEQLLYALGSVYGALNTPASEARTARIAGLRQIYGAAFVQMVERNRAQLRFLENLSTSDLEHLRQVDAAALEQLQRSFEAGDGVARGEFMQNFRHVADVLPGVYSRLKGVLVFATATSDDLGANLTLAINHYRDQFGSNDYLFRNFINLDLLNSQLQTLARRYSISLPPGTAESGLQTPEDLARFLGSESGRDLITAGRTFYGQLESTYLQGRRESGIAADAEDARGFTEGEATNLRNQLSIIDALYLGVGLGRIGSLGSEFGTSAARATMNSLLLISQRDPYLVGPFILQVLPAIISVAQDERTLVAGIEAFNTIFSRMYSTAGATLSYSTHRNREYFLEVFARIGQRLPGVTATYDHNRMEDELRRVPERQLMESPWNPQGYRYRPHFLQMEGMEPLPQLYGQAAQPWNLIPSPTMPRSLIEPPSRFGLDSGAAEYFSRMYDMLHPTLGRHMIHGIPQRYRIGALGASTIIREITRLFGEMPIDYSSYWLRHDWEVGGYYGHEGTIPTATDSDTTSTDVAAVGGVGQGRTITGGVRGRGVVTHRRTAVESEDSGDSETAETDVDIEAQAAGLPVGVAGVIPVAFGQGVGLQRGNIRFNYEGANQTTEETGEVQSRERYTGLLETYSRIARDSGGDMLVIVGGEHAPELRAPVPEGAPAGTVGELLQDERSQLRTRLFYIDGSTGNAYDLAYGIDTHAQILNYLYGSTDTRNILAGLRFAGRNSAVAPALSGAERTRLIERHLGLNAEQQAQTGEAEIERLAREQGVWNEINGESALAGFDGAAVGFTIPTTRGDTSTTLALGQVVRDMGTMTPQHAEEAMGQAITHILSDGRARDIYAGFYRGAQILEMNPEDSTSIDGSHWAEGSGEFMWRRMAIAPRQASMEFRAVGGYPLTAGARWRYERQTGAHRSYGHGLTGGYTEVDLLREFRAVDQESEEVFATMRNVLVSMYGWGEDEARDTGWLVAGTYMYGRMEGWQGTAEDQPETPNEHYASLLMAYWARRHGILAGVQRVPGFSRLYDRIDQAMLDIQQNPTNEEQILQGLSTSLQNDFTSDIWRFALGYGYDGERLRIYTIATGQWTDDETAYANLYGMFIFGRPARAYIDLLGHGYTHSSIMIVEDADSTGGFQVQRSERANPYLDAYMGFGVLDWPSIELSRYERNVTLHRTSDHPAAARDAYIRLGSVAYSHDRMERIYGEGFADIVHAQRGNGLEWMIRPVAQVRTELARMIEEDEDPLAMLISSRRSSETAEAIVDIYRELRRVNPNRERIATAYGEELVQLIENNVHSLGWVLRTPEEVETEFVRRAGTSGSVEASLSEVNIRQPPARAELTGDEVRRIIEQNIRPCLAAALNSHGRQQAERYDVIYGSHLNAEMEGGSPERRNRYFIMVTRIGTGPNSRGSIMIGTQEDLDEWEESGNYIGHGVSRLDISTEGEDYEFTFSGDRRLRTLTAFRLMGGLTIPLTEAGHEQYSPGGNWTIGALAQLLQDHRQDLLAGVLYGQRTYGNEQWTNWQVGLSHRLTLLNTERVNEQLYSYVFFNQTTRQVVFASDDVFENADEMAQVCSRLSGGECSDLNELQRTTAGVGLTWARTNITTGESLSLHFFFEGGAERRRMLEDASTSPEPEGSLHPAAEYETYPVLRGGLGVTYERQDPGSSDPGTIISGHIMGYSGSWPTAPGSVTSPEQLSPWAGQEESVTGIMNAPMGWGIMGNFRVMW